MFDTDKTKIRDVMARALYAADEEIVDKSGIKLEINFGPTQPWEQLHAETQDAYLFRAERAMEALFKHLKANPA